MEDLYSIHPGISRGGGGAAACSEASGVACSPPTPPPAAAHPSTPDLTELMKAQIAGHPRYPSLLSAYIECRKVRCSDELHLACAVALAARPARRRPGIAHRVNRFLICQVGAPPEVAALLEEIGRPERRSGGAAPGEIGLDPELDEFMVGTNRSRQLAPSILAR
jgi:hypothetical protein